MLFMKYTHAIIYMHLAAILWGFSGVLGALTAVDSSLVAFGRSIFALGTLVIWFGIPKVKAAFKLPYRSIALLLLAGLLLGVHWICFFHSISKGGVAIALITYAAAAGFIATGEVLLGWSPMRAIKIIAIILSILGIYIINPITNFESLKNEGLIYGIFSSLTISCTALFGKYLLMKDRVNSLALTLGQLGGAIVLTGPFAIRHLSNSITLQDLLIIAALGIVVSALGQTIFNKALRVVPVSSGAVIANMEAPYGVILAAILVSQPITLPITLGLGLVTFAAILVAKG